MKKSKTSKKNRKKNESTFKKSLTYLFGIFGLIAVLYWGTQNNSTPLQTSIVQYVNSKQEIADALGTLSKTEISKKNNSEDSNFIYKVLLEGENAKGQLTIEGKNSSQGITWDKITLKQDKQTSELSPLFVAKTNYYAASNQSAPLKEAIFIEGEAIYIDSFLEGLEYLNKKSTITETLSLYDEENNLVLSQKDLSSYDSTKLDKKSKGIRFSHSLRDLRSGTYHLKLDFKSGSGEVLESHWQSFQIRLAPQNTIFVKSLNYSQSKDQKIKSTSLKPNQPIYFEMALEGFETKENKIAGQVDLVIENSLGEIIAQKPKFATFTKDKKSDHQMIIDGQFKLKQPDIYLVTFRILDHFTGNSATHTDRLVVIHD